MLQPKRTKWRRNHLVRPKAKASRLVTVAFGEYGLRATQGGYRAVQGHQSGGSGRLSASAQAL